MRLNSILTAAAIAALMTGGAAAAQSSDMSSGSGMNDTSNATSANQAGTPAAAAVGNPNTVLESSPTPAADAYQLKAGDPNVITNGPVPDTPQNRARFGKPLSNAGRHTAPSGD
jgi:hypothetical protein